MERTDPPQLTKKTSPAIRESQERVETDAEASASAANWLGPAMAVWLEHEDNGLTRPAR